jgi:hypothetical protein
MQCCESGMFIPDPISFHPGLGIPDRIIKEFSTYSKLVKKMVSKLSDI